MACACDAVCVSTAVPSDRSFTVWTSCDDISWLSVSVDAACVSVAVVCVSVAVVAICVSAGGNWADTPLCEGCGASALSLKAATSASASGEVMSKERVSVALKENSASVGEKSKKKITFDLLRQALFVLF